MTLHTSRRQFLQLSGAVLLTAALPTAFGKTLVPRSSEFFVATPATSTAPIPSKAAALYRNAFVLDCNTLASIGFQVDSAASFQALRDSGLSALKSTLGGEPEHLNKPSPISRRPKRSSNDIRICSSR